MGLLRFQVVGWILTLTGVLGTLLVVFLSPHIPTPWAAGGFSLLSVVAAVGLTFISVAYSSGEWYEVYRRFKDLGIEDAEPTKQGRLASENVKWLERLGKGRETIVMVGTTNSGW